MLSKAKNIKQSKNIKQTQDIKQNEDIKQTKNIEAKILMILSKIADKRQIKLYIQSYMVICQAFKKIRKFMLKTIIFIWLQK